MDEHNVLVHAKDYYEKIGGAKAVVLELERDGTRYYSAVLSDGHPTYIGFPTFFEVRGEIIRNIVGIESLKLMNEIEDYKKDLINRL